MKFSIVIPLYNKEPYIERALRSIFAQTIQDFEIIVVDDGSTDGGAELVRNFRDSRIQLIKQENAGVSAARNKGIIEAQSEMISFLDADDAWKPEFLETIILLRDKFPDAGLYATAYEIVTAAGYYKKMNFKTIPSSPWEGIIPNYFKAAALGDPPVSSSAVSIPKYVFETVGVFPIDEVLGEDLDMWGRIALKYPVAFSSLVGATYYQNVDNSAIKSIVITHELPFVRSAAKAIDNGEVPRDILPDIREYVAKGQLDVVRINILSGNLRTAKKLLRKCRTSRFFKKKIWWYFWSMMPRRSTYFAFIIKWKILGTYYRLIKPL